MRPLLLLVLLAGPALGQEGAPVREVSADLDDDGVPEAYQIAEDGRGSVDLTVAEGGRERVVPGIAWTGTAAGTRPALSLSPAGSVLLTSMNEAVGRDRWQLTLTVAHREGEWRVAGITYEWRDTLEPEAWGVCDLNLLSGRGAVETARGRREVAVPAPAPALWDWRHEAPPVPLNPCFAG